MKKTLLIIVFAALSLFRTFADEGIWLPLLVDRLNYTDMQKMGLQLTAEEIYSINHSSLKDAIVSLNDGMCSAFMVSKDGLLMTCHHCGLKYITENSIKYNTDYLQNGFWALDKKQELYNPNLTATFLVRMEDVSQKILSQLNDNMTIEARNNKINEISKKIVDDAIKNTHYEAEVKPFFKGNEFYLFVYEIYRDIRLVGTPPSDIAKFGGDTDNWRWPRHASDFAFFRIYMGADGKPAQYNKIKNIPYSPKYYLPFTTKGVNEGDFTMVLGYPGSTDRHITSEGIKMALEEINPTITKIRDSKLRILKEFMDNDPSIKLMYKPKYSKSSNYYKYYIGQTEVLKKDKALDKKIENENALLKWAKRDGSNTNFSEIIFALHNTYNQLAKYEKVLTYYDECIFRGPEIIAFAAHFDSLYFYLKADIPEALKAAKISDLSTKLKFYSSNYHFNSYNVDVDKKIFISLLRLMKNDISSEFYPSFFEIVEKKYNDNFGSFANNLFEKSIFSNKESVYNFLREPSLKVIEKDPAYLAMLSINEKYNSIKKQSDALKIQIENNERIYLGELMKMFPDKKFYSDANNTMRVSYGKVSKYTPTDETENPYFTTLSELMSRVNPQNPDFVIPEKLKILYDKKSYSDYADANGELPVCFISDCDVSGGNSGSPILNGKGEVVGIVFDLNWEATASKFNYVPEQTRTISTDVRYILFIIDKYAEAHNIMQELEIRR